MALQQPCSKPFIVGNHVWPTAVNVVDSEYAAAVRDKVPFTTEQKSWLQLNELVLREAKAGRREEVWVTIHGYLRAAGLQTNGQVVGAYGHLGMFGAELVVEHVSDIVIEHRPTYDYRELLRRHE